MTATQIRNADCVTADIWDTVLRRTCHPEALKRYAAGLLIEALDLQGVTVGEVHRKRLEIEAAHVRTSPSGEFHLTAVVADWVSAYTHTASHVRAALVDFLVAAECAKELEVTYADAEAAALLNSLPQKPWFVSDYYCGADHISTLLANVGLAGTFAGGLVSCEEGASKRRGPLFEVARKALPLSGRWVHFGDHPHSDVAQARQYGAEGVLWQTAESGLLPAKTRQYQARQVDGQWDWGAGRMGAQDTPWVFGQKLAPLLAGYCGHVSKIAQQYEADAVLFLAREGIFLSRAFAVLEKRAFVVLDVSRRSTFAASLCGDLDAGLQQMWRQYGSQSPAAFCMTLNAPRDTFEPLFKAAGLAWDTTIDHIAAAPVMQALLASQAFATALNAHLAAEREAFCGYLVTQLGEAPQPGKTYVVADVGWKGTIQDNLARMFPESRWVGVYCGLSPVTDQPNNLKRGYVVEGARDADWAAYLKQTLPFELMFNASQGSTLGYAYDAAGKWAPCYDYIPGESVVHAGFTAEVQAGCLMALPKVQAELVRQAVSDAELKEIARQLWLQVQESPPSCLVDAAYQLEHNESFGVGSAVTFRRDLSWRELGQAVRDRKKREAVSGWLMRMPWRKVVLRQRETSWATKVALVLYELRQRVR